MKKKPRRRYRAKPRGSIFRKPLFWFSFLFLILISTAFYFLVFFEKIQIADVKISGNEKVSANELENIVSDRINRKILFLKIPFLVEKNIYSKSIFLIRKGKIVKEILDRFPIINEVKIDRKFPNVLVLDIKERKPLAVFCGRDVGSSEKCFFIDKNGIIFEDSEDISNELEKKLIIRLLEDRKEFVLGQEVVKKELLDLILQIQGNLRDGFQIDIKEAILSLPKRLDIKTSEDWQIYFNLESDVNLQITKLNLLLKEEITPEIKERLEYIDLRFTRVYYK